MTAETLLPVYGYCPHCNAPGINRERRINGDDICKKGHKYPSKDALPIEKPPAPSASEDFSEALNALADIDPESAAGKLMELDNDNMLLRGEIASLKDEIYHQKNKIIFYKTGEATAQAEIETLRGDLRLERDMHGITTKKLNEYIDRVRELENYKLINSGNCASLNNQVERLLEETKEQDAQITTLTQQVERMREALNMDSAPAIKMKHRILDSVREVMNKGYDNEYAVMYQQICQPLDEYCKQALTDAGGEG